MHELSAHNVRLRILLLNLLTITPVIFLIIYFNIVQLNRSKEIEKNQLRNVSRLFASEQEQIIEGSRQLLITLSTSSEIKNPGIDCSNYLNEILNRYQRYNNLALADLDGNVICNGAASPFQDQINISDRFFYKSVVYNKDFSIGEYSISKTTNQAILTFGYPLINSQDELERVIYASLNLSWLENLVSNFALDQETLLLILDRNGKVLAANKPELKAGVLFPSNILTNNLDSDAGFIEDNDQTNYFYAFDRIGPSSAGPYAVVGLDKSELYKKPNENFKNAVLISIFFGLFSILGGWYIGNSLITRLVLAMEKIEALRQDFISLVSHQLRTPLTAIKYFSEILLGKEAGELNKKQQEFVADINTSANRLISLVGTLLDISRLESEKVQLKLENSHIIPIIEESQREIAPLFSKKSIKITLVKKPAVPSEIQADQKLIKQAISNLISNAFKYSSPNTVIKIIIKKSKQNIVISIENVGIAIPISDKPHIFSKFFRSGNAIGMHEEGSGLGLYLTKLIIEAHNGKIWFKSRKNKTTFFFTLPIK